MTNRSKRPRDPAQLAKMIVDIATGEVQDGPERADFNPMATPVKKRGRYKKVTV